MPKPILKDIIETFTEEELNLTVPIHFQDVSLNDYEYVNTYNTYLQNGDYRAAVEYRKRYSELLDKYIFDAKKMNILISLVINSYLFAKSEKTASNTSFDTSNTDSSETNVQEVLEKIINQLNGYTIKCVDSLPEDSSKNPNTLYLIPEE